MYVADNEETDDNFPIIFHSPTTAGNYVNLQSDASTFTYNPSIARLFLGQAGESILYIDPFNLDIDSTADTFTLFTSVDTINMGGSEVKAINIGGVNSISHSIVGNTLLIDHSSDIISPTGPVNDTTYRTYISGGLAIDLINFDDVGGNPSASFYIYNITESSERRALVINDSGRVTRADADFAVDIVASGSQILTVTSSNELFGVVFTKRVQSELTGSGDLQEHVPQGSTGLVFSPSRTQLTLQNQIPEINNNNDYLILEPGGISSSGSETFSVLTGGYGPSTINVGVGNGTVFFQGSASIAGDLIVQGTTTTLSTENLLVEDRYILLGSSSADNNVGGGIIVQKATTGVGTALHWDDASETWAVDIEGADASTDTAKGVDAKIAFISSSAGLPGASFNGPVIVGSNDNYKKGQFYVDTTDDYGLYVYL